MSSSGDAGVGVHTYQVALFDSDNLFQCGGSLVAYDIVITAGNCLNFVTKAKIGLYHLDNPAGSETIDICKKVSLFDEPEPSIVLLKLCQVSSLAQQGTVKTIKLNACPSVPTDGQVLTTTGWGRVTYMRETLEGLGSNTLQKADLNYNNTQPCWASSVSSANMCAGFRDGCENDIGGPLVIGTSATDFALVGVIFSKLGCGLPPPQYAPPIDAYGVRISSVVSSVLSEGCAMTAISPCGIQTTKGEHGEVCGGKKHNLY